ncbi:serine proteinase stubble [Caerostris extrusa]|uniref:Serine proteinase stubble n=1 Tax=Caerostris extrusa TaxID=172846 RepID=A0AAV4PRE5_CAEEX|nr:serine proteinase stubble [Caerostris extrusa]
MSLPSAINPQTRQHFRLVWGKRCKLPIVGDLPFDIPVTPPAAVLKAEGKVNIFQCGGVLIDKYHVLTVAHCVFHLYKYDEYPLKVRLGEWDTQTTSEFLAHEDYNVSKILVHPEFRNTSLWNDVALLRLSEPVLFAPHIDTVCLPQHDEIFAGQNCVVTGWGKDAYKGGTFSNVMKEVALQVIEDYKCEEMLRKTRLGRFYQLHEGFLCAGGEYGLDPARVMVVVLWYATGRIKATLWLV